MPEVPKAPLRILHAPRNVANQAGHAAAGLRRRGHHVEIWEDRPSVFGFAADRVLPYESKDPQAVWQAVVEAVDRFDVLHFHFAQTLVPLGWGGLPPFWDLPLYRALGKRVFVTFHGTDVRVRRIHEAINPWSYLRDAADPPEDDRIEKTIEVFRTYADAMFAVSVNLLHFVPQAAYLPRIFDLAAWPEEPREQRERPLLVHAPSRRETKGTDTILAALAGLEAEGVPFELRLLERVSHERVREEMAAADIVVDNLNAGAYGVVSMEAMALGRVAIANLSDDVRAAHPDCPVVHVDPPSFAGRLRELIGDVAERRRLADLGRPFVARVHDADEIAARLEAAYMAPPGRVARRAMPDWMSGQPARRIEQLEERLDRAEMELARARHREERLRARPGQGPIHGPDVAGLRAAVRRILPPEVRTRLSRGRRRA